MLIETMTQFPEDSVVIFNHIPKVGGTSIYRLFLAMMGDEQCFRHRARIPGTNQFTKPIKALSRRERQNLRFVMGHFEYGNHKMFKQPSLYIGVVRDPVDRLASDYYYNRERGQEKHKAKAQSLTLEEYALDKLNNPNSQMVNNSQIRLLTGEDTLEAAQMVLRERFLLVCTTPQLDEFQQILQSLFGIEDTQVYRHNVTKTRKVDIDLSSETFDAIYANNNVDIALYHYIHAKFEHIKQNWL